MFIYNEILFYSNKIRLFAKQFAKDKNLFTHALEVAKSSIDYLERDYLGNSDGVPLKIGKVFIYFVLGLFEV